MISVLIGISFPCYAEMNLNFKFGIDPVGSMSYSGDIVDESDVGAGGALTGEVLFYINKATSLGTGLGNTVFIFMSNISSPYDGFAY